MSNGIIGSHFLSKLSYIDATFLVDKPLCRDLDVPHLYSLFNSASTAHDLFHELSIHIC